MNCLSMHDKWHWPCVISRKVDQTDCVQFITMEGVAICRRWLYKQCWSHSDSYRHVVHVNTYQAVIRKRSTAVGTATTTLRTGRSGVRIPVVTHGPNQPPTQWIPGPFPGVKRPRREADHSLPSSAEVKNQWSYTSVPPICFHDVDRESFAVTM